MFKKIIVLLVTSFILVPNSYAIYLRAHVPVSTTSNTDCTGTWETECSPKSSGYSLRGIFGLFGVGIASSKFDFHIDNEWDLTSEISAFDISLSFLDAMITAGYGTVTSGELAGSVGEIALSGGSGSGSTTFINFGFGLGPVELIAGYRQWDATISGGTASYGGTSAELKDLNPKYSEMTLGVGVGF